MKARSSVAGDEERGLERSLHVPVHLLNVSSLALRMMLALVGIASTSACESIDVVKPQPFVTAGIKGSNSLLLMGEKRVFRFEANTGAAFQTVAWTSSSNLALVSPLEACGAACVEVSGLRPGPASLVALGRLVGSSTELGDAIALTVQ